MPVDVNSEDSVGVIPFVEVFSWRSGVWFVGVFGGHFGRLETADVNRNPLREPQITNRLRTDIKNHDNEPTKSLLSGVQVTPEPNSPSILYVLAV